MSDKSEATRIDSFQPNYKRRCFCCDQKPTVDVVKDGKVIDTTEMCGPCAWGEAAMLDPEEWNR